MKNVPTIQWIFIGLAVIYLLESILFSNLFLNPILLAVTVICGIVVAVMSGMNKTYNWLCIDLIITLLCIGMAYIIYI